MSDQPPKGSHVRIVCKVPNVSDMRPGYRVRPKGQDVFVSLVMDDGTEVPIPDVVMVGWKVDSRRDYCEAVLKVYSVEVDLRGELVEDLSPESTGEYVAEET
jgi:hypothetical protein